MYIYVIDPGSGVRLEIFTNGYLIFEPDWEPIRWTLDEMDVGFTFWGDQTDSNRENNPTIEAIEGNVKWKIVYLMRWGNLQQV